MTHSAVQLVFGVGSNLEIGSIGPFKFEEFDDVSELSLFFSIFCGFASSFAWQRFAAPHHPSFAGKSLSPNALLDVVRVKRGFARIDSMSEHKTFPNRPIGVSLR